MFLRDQRGVYVSTDSLQSYVESKDHVMAADRRSGDSYYFDHKEFNRFINLGGDVISVIPAPADTKAVWVNRNPDRSFQDTFVSDVILGWAITVEGFVHPITTEGVNVNGNIEACQFADGHIEAPQIGMFESLKDFIEHMSVKTGS